MGAVAVMVTGLPVAFRQVAGPLVSSFALLIFTSLESEVVHNAYTSAIVVGMAHPLPDTTKGELCALNLTWFAGGFKE